MTATTTEQARTRVSRAVLWTGIALGTCLAVLAITDGVRLRIGGMPSVLGAVLGAAVVWALIVLAAVALAELVRRHHRTVGQYALRQGKRGAVSTARHGRTVRTWLVSKAGPRWESRQHQPLMFRRHRRNPDSPAGDPGPAAPVSAPPAPNPLQPSPSTEGTPMAPNLTGRHSGPRFREHTFAQCSPDLCGEQPAALAGKYASRIAPERRARRAATRSGGRVPSDWGPVIAQTADFEPEDDGELLEWMSRQVTGLSAWAEALVDFYDHCTATIGIDPKASAMLHDVADAAAQAAETMGAAKAKFTEHYELPREFAGNGGLMTHDGRWITGEGA